MSTTETGPAWLRRQLNGHGVDVVSHGGIAHVARQLGVARSTLADILTEGLSTPSIATARALAELLEHVCTVDVLRAYGILDAADLPAVPLKPFTGEESRGTYYRNAESALMVAEHAENDANQRDPGRLPDPLLYATIGAAWATLAAIDPATIREA